jgi:RNA polymerase sigma factor (sigma-70 family)
MTADPPDLIHRAQQGDQGAFEALYHQHVGRVYAVCLRLTGDRGRAEELTQDAFVRAWERLGSFRGDSAFASWLYRVAVNVVYLSLRAAGRPGGGRGGWSRMPGRSNGRPTTRADRGRSSISRAPWPGCPREQGPIRLHPKP